MRFTLFKRSYNNEYSDFLYKRYNLKLHDLNQRKTRKEIIKELEEQLKQIIKKLEDLRKYN